jgi:hypothetical protein
MRRIAGGVERIAGMKSAENSTEPSRKEGHVDGKAGGGACSMLTIPPDYLFRCFVQGRRIGKEITLYSVWFELRWGITHQTSSVSSSA